MKKTINAGFCFLCGTTGRLEKHHIYGGSRRKKSEKYGLSVMLCAKDHKEGPESAHKCKETADKLHRIGQEEFEKTHTRAEFMHEFGKNYL